MALHIRKCRDDVTAAMTSDVIALPREAIHAGTTMNWEDF